MTRRTASGIAPRDGWKPVAERGYDGRPAPGTDPRDVPLELVLTPQERDQVALAKLHLEQHRRELNRRDTAQSLADELARREAAGEPPIATTPNQPFIGEHARKGGDL